MRRHQTFRHRHRCCCCHLVQAALCTVQATNVVAAFSAAQVGAGARACIVGGVSPSSAHQSPQQMKLLQPCGDVWNV